uniref:Transmembrane protein 51b n=1 Tax=Monopterus albus TaxID=43700 RepID=A0A3Q3IUY5_MONAL
MCSSRGVCSGNNRPNRSPTSDGNGLGAHYALCALGVGLIALGIVMIVWTVIPVDGGASDQPDSMKSSSVAMVLVGVGAVMLLLSIFLGVRSKRRARSSRNQPVAAPLMDQAARPQEEAADPTMYTVPSYEEVIGSDTYPVRQSNLRQSTSQLPSYEDIIAAPQAGPPGLTSNPSLPVRSSSRASRLLQSLRVRRIKSDRLHLKDFRLQIRSPTQNPVTIEPITPPPQYEHKMPELQ